MIPKVIHYCWFGNSEMPRFFKQCLKTWQNVLPDYKLRRWDEKSIETINLSQFAKDALQAKKWAFVADYVRLYALYTEGGIYLDTDVKVYRPFDEFLSYNFFSAHEKQTYFFDESEQAKLNEDKTPKDPNDFVMGFHIHTAVMGSVAGLHYLKECLDYYNSLTFDLKNHKSKDYIIGYHITRPLYKYGYRFVDEDQLLNDNMMIKKSSVFVGNILYMDKNPYTIHCCTGSWRDNADNFDQQLRLNHPLLSSIYGFFLRPIRKFLRIIKS